MKDVERLAIDAIRVLSMDAVQQANSGHPGTPMALAPVGYVLFHRHLRHNPKDPDWLDRDRFVLSAGHASMLIYSLLHLSGYDLSEKDIRNFRQWGSPTAGHPEHGHVPGVETTTGPLGQGVANSVGMALAERWLAERFNRTGHEIVDHFTYALCSDGDLMEGVSHEAAAIAGHQRLGKLIWIFDDNQITIEGGTDLSTSTNQAKRFEGYGWHTLHVHDGNDLEAIDVAIREAQQESERPSLIVLRTTIAYGSPGKAGTSASHGAPLGADEIEATKKNLGYPSLEPFHVDEGAREHWSDCVSKGQRLQDAWHARFSVYQAEMPEMAAEFSQMMAGHLPEGWDQAVPDLSHVESGDATRGWSGKVLQGLAAGIPNLVGGSADLGSSNKTDIVGANSLLPDTPSGRVVHYGVREHAMGSIMNGIILHGGIRPYAGTFLIFSDYMRPAIRLAGLMGRSAVYVFSHDSIGLGEDGPTHQPVEQLAALRAIPNVADLRPGDAAETEIAWRVAIQRSDGPSFLALSRQKVAVLGPQRTTRVGRGTAPRCLRAHRGFRGPARGDPHRERIGTRAGGRGPRTTGGRRGSDPGRQHAELVPVRTAEPELPRRRVAVVGEQSNLGRSRQHVRMGTLGGVRRSLHRHRPLRSVGTRRRPLREVRPHRREGRGGS